MTKNDLRCVYKIRNSMEEFPTHHNVKFESEIRLVFYDSRSTKIEPPLFHLRINSHYNVYMRIIRFIKSGIRRPLDFTNRINYGTILRYARFITHETKYYFDGNNAYRGL